MKGSSLAFIIIFSALCGASIVTALFTHALAVKSWRPDAIGAVICAAIVALTIIYQ